MSDELETPEVVRALSRRTFLLMTGSALAASSTVPVWMRVNRAGAEGEPARGRKLVVLYLAGGNDGLNTLVPYGHGAYYDARPTIAYRAEDVIRLSDSGEVGLHPSLVALGALYEERKVAIVQGVGYERPDLSHFGSLDVWECGSPTHAASTGWLGRYLDRSNRGGVVPAVAIGNSLPQSLVGAEQSGVAVPSFGGFTFADGSDSDTDSEPYRLHEAFRRGSDAPFEGVPARALLGSQRRAVTAVRAINRLGDPAAPPPATLADQMSMAVTILGSDLGCEIAYLSIGSFDDHASTATNHPKLLTRVDQAIARFTEEIARTATPDDYLLMTFSEFGRRVAEDGSAGTDHGTAAPMFVVGAGVAGGLYGVHPSLTPTELDANRNMVPTVDFREVYATLLDGWLGAGAAEVLGTAPADGLRPVPFLR